MPAIAPDVSEYPHISQKRKCPTSHDAFHVAVWSTMVMLAAAGLQPATVTLACGCKWDWIDIPNAGHGGARKHLRLTKKKPEAAKVQVRVEGISASKARKRFDEAQLTLWPTSRRSPGSRS